MISIYRLEEGEELVFGVQNEGVEFCWIYPLAYSLHVLLNNQNHLDSSCMGDIAGHTVVRNNMVTILIHGSHNILEQVAGIFEGMVYLPQPLLQAIYIQFAFALRIQTLPKRLYPRIPRILRLWEIHILLREQFRVMG